MSLVGNLEDLGLGEILQIVSLSRKSGVLELNSRDRSGKVVFRSGQVIRATATTFPENIGDLLLRSGLIDFAKLKQAVQIQQGPDGAGRRIGDIVVDQFGIARDEIDKLVREQTERIVYSFFTWNEGDFSFELGEPEELAATILNPLHFMLDSGLNPQWLAMEGSRLYDEKRHRGDETEEYGESIVDLNDLLEGERAAESAGVTLSPPPAPTDASPAGAPPRRFLIVDDDATTGEELVKLLRGRNFQAQAFDDGEAVFAVLGVADPTTTTLVIDLIMPRRSGSGVFGGLELLEEVRLVYPELPVLVITDQEDITTEAAVRRLGVPELLPKPTRADVAAGVADAELHELADTLCSLAGSGGAPLIRDKQLFNIGVELYRELGEASGLTLRQTRQSPGLHLLRSMLEELNNPSLGGGIILLILRFASELMNRAVIFLVKEKEIVGLGQFGIELAGKTPDILVRNTRIPTGEESLFSNILVDMKPAKMIPQDCPWDDYLFNQFGGTRAQEVFLGPLISEGRIVAILYGDNLPEQKPIGDTEALEVFLSEAGLAMEKALQERRLTDNRAAV